MKKKRFASTQITVYLVVYGLIIMLTTPWVVRYALVKDIRPRLVNKARVVGKMLSWQLQKPLIANDLATVEQATKNLGGDAYLSYVAIKDTNGKTIFGIHDALAPPIRETPLEDINDGIFFLDHERKNDFIYPVMNGEKKLGYVQLGFFDALVGKSATKAMTPFQACFVIVTILAIICVRYLLSRNIIKPLQQMSELANSLAAGDLSGRSIEVKGNNEITALNEAIYQVSKEMKKSLSAMKKISSRLVLSSSSAATTTSQLSLSANQQATAISQTSTTVEEIRRTGEISKEKAGKISKSSAEALVFSEEGLSAVEKSVNEFKEVRNEVERIAASIEAQLSLVGEVEDVISTVNELAEQSNVLAINASIEAAKAGEYGRGFTVVSQEITNLANESKAATAQIRGTLGKIQSAIQSSVEMTKQGKDRVEKGVHRIENTGRIISRLRTTIADAAEVSKGIANSTNEQFVGLEQIVQAMLEIGDTATKNTSHAKAVDQSSEQQQDMSAELAQLVKRYKF
jgi:methyl-accepting chemotaxis protein